MDKMSIPFPASNKIKVLEEVSTRIRYGQTQFHKSVVKCEVGGDDVSIFVFDQFFCSNASIVILEIT